MSTDDDSEIFALDEEQLSCSYTNFEVMHSGANSVVLRAKRNGQWWTLKAINAACRGMDVYRNLQQKELDIQQALHHPHIAQAYRIEQIEGYGPCIVMEWVDGQNLRQWLATHPSRRERLRVLGQLISAVGYMHQRQVVHRDLKPENVMVTHNGHNVKVIDFGLADTDQYANMKQPSGTRGYMAPEQASEHQADSRNDIYSLGCIIQDLKLGRPYSALARRCILPKEQRPQCIDDMKLFVHRRRNMRKALLAMAAFVVVALAAWGIYMVQERNGRPRYEEVARFKVENVVYTSWGGMVVSAQLYNKCETRVVIPNTVTYKGITYTVSELGFDSFRNDTSLRSVLMTNDTDTLNILRGSFKNCPNLQNIYFDCTKLVGIGGIHWPCPIDSLFEPYHYDQVTLHVRPPMLQTFRNSEWRRFKHIVTF